MYFAEHERIFPINPFQIMSDLGIHFVFRKFDKLEGLFMPATETENINLVVINVKRNITRQRFTAVHEVCHFLKDAGKQFVCRASSQDEIEKYADAFVSAFLMPIDELKHQIELREGHNKYLSEDDVLIIADHFGTSYESCYYRIHNCCPSLLPYKNSKEIRKFKPDRRRKELGLSYIGLYEDLINAWDDISTISNEFAKQVFKRCYVYNDSRLEGVDSTYEVVSEIVQDLYDNKQTSEFCNENYEAFCNIAGHAHMYDFVFEHAYDPKIEVYALSSINKSLFSCVSNPEYGGSTRTDNTLVIGTKLETVDWHDVMTELIKLNDSVIALDKKAANMSRSEIIKEIIKIHHRITVIHPFSDGNGRTSRGFMNEMLIRYGMPPVYVKLETKEKYYDGVALADKSKDYVFFMNI